MHQTFQAINFFDKKKKKFRKRCFYVTAPHIVTCVQNITKFNGILQEIPKITVFIKPEKKCFQNDPLEKLNQLYGIIIRYQI